MYSHSLSLGQFLLLKKIACFILDVMKGILVAYHFPKWRFQDVAGLLVGRQAAFAGLFLDLFGNDGLTSWWEGLD